MASRKSVSHFSTQPRTLLPGSEKPPIAPGDLGSPISTRHRITVSVMVRRKAPLQSVHAIGEQRLTRAEFQASHAADPVAVKLVRAFAKEFGLTVQPGTPAPGRRTIKLTGTIANLERAFGVSLVHKSLGGGGTCRVREGGIYLPQELVGPIVAVLGLDNRPQAEPHFRLAGDPEATSTRIAQAGGFARPHASAISYTPVQVGQLYGFPLNSTAASQTIALLELGGGFRQADLTAYFKSLGQKPPQVVAVSVSGAKNSPGNANGADGEVMLDIEVAAAVAPGARIVVYFAPNTDQGFIDAIGAAVHDTKYKPSILSISWGAPEVRWTAQAMNALDAVCQSAAALGITITVAAGDNGSSDGVSDNKNHVDFPASSPHVLACGGTSLESSNGAITSETVWNDQSGGATGGGVSNVFALPSWQSGANVPKPSSSTGGRGVPDVAGNADPNTGYTIRVDGQTMVIGGTSAVAPLWAGLIALANQQNGISSGFINPAIYTAAARPAFHDITQGNNGAFQATIGWDACTGLGSPAAPQLIATVKPSKVSVKKKPTKRKGKKAAAKKSARTVARKKLPGKKKPPLKRGKSKTRKP